MNALPSWITPPDTALDDTRTPTNREFIEGRFEIAFDVILDLIAEGCMLDGALARYPIPFSPGRYNQWINRSPERRRRYEEAKALRTEVLAGKALAHAEGIANPLEDVQRSKLVVDTCFRIMGADNKQVYGPSTRHEVTHTLSILEALREANGRTAQPLVIEHDASTPITIEHAPQYTPPDPQQQEQDE